MTSVPRAFAEWKMAAAVAAGKELAEGDVIVLAGTLQTGQAARPALPTRCTARRRAAA